MHQRDNAATVQGLFAAYQRGDLAAVLAGVADDVVWEFPGPPDIPMAGRRSGPGQVAEFFRTMSDATEMRHFQPRQFVSQGDQVVAIGSSIHVVRESGREIAIDWVMVFDFREGKIARFREFTDTAVLSRAFDRGHSMLEGRSGTP